MSVDELTKALRLARVIGQALPVDDAAEDVVDGVMKRSVPAASTKRPLTRRGP
jgi:hypothetical protein